MHVGDILSTMGVCSTMVDINDACGGYLEYHGGCAVPWWISTINLVS